MQGSEVKIALCLLQFGDYVNVDFQLCELADGAMTIVKVSLKYKRVASTAATYNSRHLFYSC